MICKYHTYTHLDTKTHQFCALSAHIVVQRISDKAPNFHQPHPCLSNMHATSDVRALLIDASLMTFGEKKWGGVIQVEILQKPIAQKKLCQDHFPASHAAYVYIYTSFYRNTFSILNHFWHTWHTWYSLFNWNQETCQLRNSWIFK